MIALTRRQLPPDRQMKTYIKLFAAMMLAGLCLFLGVLGYQVYDLEHNQKRRLTWERSSFAYKMTKLAVHEFHSADESGRRRLCAGLYNRDEMVYAAIIDDHNKVALLCTDRDSGAILAERDRFQKGGLQGEVKIIGITAVPIRNLVLKDNGKKLGALEIAYTWTTLYEQFRARAKAFLTFFLLLSAVLGAALVFLVRALLAPLDRFASSLKKIESEWPLSPEDFQARLEPEKAGPEIKPVLDALKTSLVKLLERQEELREAEKLSALGKLSAQVAHDIRSPLAALGAAAKGFELPREQRALVSDAVNRIQGIADDLLECYRAPGAPAGPKVGVHLLAGLIGQVVSEKRLQHKDKPEIRIEFREDQAGARAAVDPKEFQRALSNLLNNSLEAFDGAGAVSVELSATGEKVLVEVKDNGKGIKPEVLARLGQKGETHEKAGGTGLGLYHARTAVEAWGGKFKIESAPGKGTTVMIELPRAAARTSYRTAILLDDDPLVHMNWKLAAKAAAVELKVFKNKEDFAAEVKSLPKDTPIYIDSDLGNNVKGEDIALELRKKGFTELTMATGHGPEKFAHLAWLKVTGKEPPF